MKKFYFSFSILFIFVSFLSFGQSFNKSKGIQANIVSTSSNSTTIEFILNNYDKTNIDINGSDYIFYNIPGSIWLMQKGMPQLPAHRASIIIPDLAGMNFRIIDQQFTEIETTPVVPSKGHFTRNIDPSKVPYTFNEFYTQDRWFPENNISLDNPYIVRELRGLTIQFNPMQFNPVEKKLKICTRIVVKVYSDPNAPVINPFIREKAFSGVSKEFEDVYKTLFINYGTANYNYVPLNEIGRLLIIYPVAFASDITPFYNWKVEKGIPTILAEYPTETGSGSAAIKTYIQNLYDSPDGLTFIVLVGESNQIPTLSGQYEGAASDPCYVKLEGTDAYPDAYISRISPSSAANLDYILYKMIKYEKFPNTGTDAAWYLKGTGVASAEGSPTDYSRANLLRDMLINNMNFTTVDQIYDPGATTIQVTNALNDGRSILNYIGHGSGTSWGTTGFDNADIYNLSNGYKNPVILDVACENGDFTMSECMEEAWVRAGSDADPKGAIAAFGASTLASWVPPCDMQNHAIDLLTNREKQTVGGICFNGIMYAMDLWGGSSGEGLKMMEQYNIMGDCSMQITLGMIPDSTAPTQILDLTAVNPTSNSVTLNWTAPFDSSIGGIISYDLRYSVNPILNDNDYNNANSVLISGEPDSAGMAKNYRMNNFDFNTQYYFAIKAMDIWGNKSEMSNTTTETTWIAPQISTDKDSLNCTLVVGNTHADSVIISNVTTDNSTLDYSIELTNNTFPGNIKTSIVPVKKTSEKLYTKNNPDLSKGMGIKGSGGPDAYGYEWIDSNDPNGPVYEWNDISVAGTLITNWVPIGTYAGEDEGKTAPINLGFNFKFYGIEYNQVYFYSNGFIGFNDLDDAYFSNGSIPDVSLPNNIIAGIWDDLDGEAGGSVYYLQEPNKFTVQFTNWNGYASGTGPFTFQIVLNKNGKILFYYNSIQGTSTSATVGIENQDGTDGLQLVRNASYLENNLAVQFASEPDWLAADNLEGTIYNGNSASIVINYLTDGLETGDYSMDLVINSNDPNNPSLTIPVKMKVVNEVPVELTSFTAKNSDGEIILKWQTATETNNRGFEIVRSEKTANKKDYKWNKVSFVDGNGSSSEVNIYSYKDKISKTGTYIYRLNQIDFDGTINKSNEVEVKYTGPKEFTLYQNYPNPFNPNTTIKFAVPQQIKVSIKIYNLLGELVKELINNKEFETGYHEIKFDARNLSSGIYIYRIETGSFTNSKKMILMK